MTREQIRDMGIRVHLLLNKKYSDNFMQAVHDEMGKGARRALTQCGFFLRRGELVNAEKHLRQSIHIVSRLYPQI